MRAHLVKLLWPFVILKRKFMRLCNGPQKMQCEIVSIFHSELAYMPCNGSFCVFGNVF